MNKNPLAAYSGNNHMGIVGYDWIVHSARMGLTSEASVSTYHIFVEFIGPKSKFIGEKRR